jgi:hypothetical protein
VDHPVIVPGESPSSQRSSAIRGANSALAPARSEDESGHQGEPRSVHHHLCRSSCNAMPGESGGESLSL